MGRRGVGVEAASQSRELGGDLQVLLGPAWRCEEPRGRTGQLDGRVTCVIL